MEERSGSTHQDTEQGVTAAATIIASTPLQLLPSHPPLETSITQTSDQDAHLIESDPVPPRCREEKSEESITTINAPAHNHPDQRGHHEAPTTERISDGGKEEIAPHLETSFSPEVYHPLNTILYTLYTILTLTSKQDMAHDRTFIASHPSFSCSTSISLVQTFSSPVQHRRRTLDSCIQNPLSNGRIMHAASLVL